MQMFTVQVIIVFSSERSELDFICAVYFNACLNTCMHQFCMCMCHFCGTVCYCKSGVL